MRCNSSPIPVRAIAVTAALAAAISIGTAATTFIWNVPSPGGANNWNVNANWTPNTGNPGAGDTAQFSGTGTNTSSTTVNNVVSVNTSIANLWYTQQTNGTWHVTQIADGMTLTTSGSVIVGAGTATGVQSADGAVTSAAMVGGGTFQASGATFVIGNQGNAALNSGTILDLTGLTNFVYNNSAGLIGMGISNRCTASLSLANGSNYITAGTINLDTGSTSSSGTAGNLKFGAGTNVVNVGTITNGAGRTAGTVNFVTTTGGLRLRGTAGGDNDRVATVMLGNRNTGSSTGGTTTGTLAWNGHAIDAKIATLNMGQESSAANAGLIGVGNVSFDQGVIDVTTINMAVLTGNQSNNIATGTMTVGAGGTLLVNSISLANTSLTTNNVGASGTLFVNGGLVICTNNIFKTGTLSVNTGTVAIASSGTNFILGKIGTPANPVDNLNVTNGNIQLRVDGSGTITTNICVLTVNPSGTTTFIVDQAIAVTGPTTFPLVSYSTLNGTVAGNFAVIVPAGYSGGLVDNSAQKRIDLSISPNVIVVPFIWSGATNGNWDMTTTNWLQNGAIATYADNNPVIFDDSASTSVVNLTTTLSPSTMTMSNSILPYTFSGSGSLAGTNTLTTRGTAKTVIDNSGSNSYTGGTIVGIGSTLVIGNTDAKGNLPGGTSVIDNGVLEFRHTDNITVDNAISGAGQLTQNDSGTLTLVGGNGYNTTTISAGTLQVGAGGTSGSLGSGAVTDNGSLIFNRSDNITVANAINGTGSVTKNNANVLTISASNTFNGGLTVNSGIARLSNTNAAGRGAITINPTGTAVLGVALTNAITLAGGTLSSSAGLNPLLVDITAAASTTSTILYADPANLTAADPNEMNIIGTLHGSGNIVMMSVTNDPTPDSGNGFRLRGTNASDFSGTITISNRVKFELQNIVAGPFSPAGVGKLQVVCGILTNNTVNGTFGELNVRNNNTNSLPGDTVFTNDVELIGSGIAVLDPLGSAPAGTRVVMVKLTMGGGQELGVDVNSAPDHLLVFPRVTLTGGNAAFSPKTPGWNTSPGASVGSDLSLGNIIETSSSGIVMNGLRTLFLTGTNSYSGATTVSNGVLAVNGSNGPSAITVYGGTLGGTGVISGPVEIASGGTLAPGSSIGTLAISNTLTLDSGSTNTMEINAGSVTSDQVVGLSSVSYGGTLNVVNLGGTLAANQTYKLFDAASYAGTFAATNLPALGSGLGWDVSGLNSNGTIKIIATVNLNPTNITVSVSGNQLTLSWPSDHLGWTLQTNASSILDTNWFAVPGSESSTQAVITVSPAVPNVFYRLMHAVP